MLKCDLGRARIWVMSSERPSWAGVAEHPQTLPRFQGLFNSKSEALTVFGCLWAPAVAPPRLWDLDTGHCVLPCARTPWAAPSWSWRGGFQASEGCGQPGSKACPWVKPQLFLADETQVCDTICWHFVLAICFLF